VCFAVYQQPDRTVFTLDPYLISYIISLFDDIRLKAGLMPTATRTLPASQAAAIPGDIATEKALAVVAKALSHPARIHIVRLLLEKQTCIGCDIVDEVGLAQSTVSEHLRILKSAAIIRGEIERPRVCYSLNPDSLLPLAGLLNCVFAKHQQGKLNASICCPVSSAEPAL
jgi:ArsR family transcriptional regulator